MDERRAASQDMYERDFAAGEVLFHEGEASFDLYILLKGAVAVSKAGREVARIEEPGAYFGEMSSLLEAPRSATVTATEAARFLVVPPERLPDLFGNTPQLALRIARSLAERLAQTTADLVREAPPPQP